jgi:hypothetical protein
LSEPEAKTEEDEDSFAVLMREAGELRDRMRETVADLGRLLKTARAAHREHSDLNREHCAVKRTIRSLQTI